MKYTLWICSIMLVFPLFTESIMIIAHRGASGYEPENTLRSFKKAVDMQVAMIELDVYVCKTGEVVVIHDDTIDRTTNGKGSVHQLTLEKLQQYDAGKGEHIPLLSQVFDTINRKAIIDIEIKDPKAVKPVADLITYYVGHKGWAYTDFIVSSFDCSAICEFKSHCAQVKTGMIFERPKSNYLAIIKQAGAHYAIVDYPSITAELVKDVHHPDNKGIQLFAYTLNDAASIKKITALGVDGIITNYPDLAKNVHAA